MASESGKCNDKSVDKLLKSTDEKSKKPVAKQIHQQVEGQSIQVQLSHDESKQTHTQATQVASSNTTIIRPSTMVMPTPQQTTLFQQKMQNLQNIPTTNPMPSQCTSTTITGMDTGASQQMTNWPSHGRFQVVQPSIQNPTYIHSVYNGQGQLIAPGSTAIHSANINQPIRVIATEKGFEAGQMSSVLTTAQDKQLAQGQTTSFSGYATIPASGSNQTFVVTQMGVLGQTNLLPATAQQQGKQQDISKNKEILSKNKVTAQCETITQPQNVNPIQYTCNTQQQQAVPQGTMQAMQFAPWQATIGSAGLSQGLPWAPTTLQSSAFLTQGSQIFIRNPQHEQVGIFINNAQAPSTEHHNKIPSSQIKPNQPADMNRNTKSKFGMNKTFPTILPNSIGPRIIRPGCNVGTQTEQAQTYLSQNNFESQTFGNKIRMKNVPPQNSSMMLSKKTNAQNQMKPSGTFQNLQPKIIVPRTPQQCTLGSISLSPQGKLKKQAQTQTQLLPHEVTQQVQAHQSFIQTPQMQNIFQQHLDQKGQILISDGIQTGEHAPVPMISMTTPMSNMIFQALPGILTMPPELSISANTVQGVSITPQIVQTSATVSLETPAKQKDPEQKENTVQENGGLQTTPGRFPNENTTSSEKFDEKVDKRLAEETEENNQLKEKFTENKEKEENEKKYTDKDVTGTGQPKAMVMVKPQILTHVTENFALQEPSEPLPVSEEQTHLETTETEPVNRGTTSGLVRRLAVNDNLESNEPPRKKLLLNTRESSEGAGSATCHTCGKKDTGSAFENSNRFSSLSFAEGEDEETNSEDENMEENESADESSLSPAAGEIPIDSTSEDINRINPLHWTVADVCEFIRTIPGCAEYAEDFVIQEIDGEALMLLKPEHLMTVMSMKLGPAVKIIHKINLIRMDNYPKPE